MKSRARKLSILIALYFVVGAGALAFWTTTGSGNGTATAATLAPPTNVTVPSNVAGTVVPVSWTATTPPGSGPVGYYVQRFAGVTPSRRAERLHPRRSAGRAVTTCPW